MTDKNDKRRNRKALIIFAIIELVILTLLVVYLINKYH
jgi:predicted nucleic acid-binding Zn ribbon protein